MIYLYVLGGFALLIIVGLWIARQEGKSAERVKQAEADLDAAKTVAEKNAAIRKLSDKEVQKLRDRWTKKS